MTQSFSSSSLSNDKRDENAPSSEIRADIDQTRASVGEKIDQLQARLDPSRLKQQAQETVQEMFTDTANSMTDYVKTHKDELVSSLADAARRNPLPTALVGLGVGWLILESMSGSKRHDDDRYEYERRNFSTRDMSSRFEGSTGRSQVYQGRGQDYYNQYDQPDYRTTSYPTNAEYRSEYQGRQEYGNGHQQGSNPLAKAADAVKGAVGDVAQDIKERAEGVGNDIKERVEDMSQGIKDRASDMRQNVDERVGDMRHDMNDRMGGMRQQASHMGGQGERSLQRAGYRMEEWQARARYEGQRRGQQAMRNLEDNPLTYGAVALAAGVALALLLPQTRTENRAFGEMRDQVMDKGREVVESAKSQAQEVIAEVRPELEEKARQIVNDATELGKEVAKDAASELRPIVDKVVEKGKEGAVNTAKEAGIDPEKLTSGSSSGSGSSKSGSTGSGSTGSGSTGSGSSLAGSSVSGTGSTGSSASGSGSTGSGSTGSGSSGSGSSGSGSSGSGSTRSGSSGSGSSGSGSTGSGSSGSGSSSSR